MSLQDVLEPSEAPATAAAEPSQPNAPAKGPFKSWRKKYRKMRVRFENVVRENNALFRDEHLLLAKARRLQERNDQLLEVLVDMNESSNLPPHLHYALDRSTPGLSEVPSLEADIDPRTISPRQGTKRTHEQFAADSGPTTTSLKVLEQVPHAASAAPDSSLPPNMTGDLPGYFSPDHEEEYLQNVDAAIAAGFGPATARLMRAAADKVIPNAKDTPFRNPVSVVNWLRRNQPSIFLQDKELENGSEPRSAAKANAASRGKRASMVAAAQSGARAEHDSLDDELGSVPDGGAAGARGRKSKGGEDDGAYRPPRGGGKGGKRKREDTGEKGTEKPAKRKYVRQSVPANAGEGA